MNERREMYETYWAFEAGKWTKIDSVDRQVVPEIYDAFSKKVGSNGAIAKIFKNLIRLKSKIWLKSDWLHLHTSWYDWTMSRKCLLIWHLGWLQSTTTCWCQLTAQTDACELRQTLTARSRLYSTGCQYWWHRRMRWNGIVLRCNFELTHCELNSATKMTCFINCLIRVTNISGQWLTKRRLK